MELKKIVYNLLSVSHGLRHGILYIQLLINPKEWKPKFMIDISFGWFMYSLLNGFLGNVNISENVISLATVVKSSLDELLRWLMGAPAGLKLNEELSYFLGNFFLYHVEIWMTYLLVISVYLPSIAYVVMLTNFFGLSMFLSFLVDVINGLAFHLYCFYVYASKLYHVQLKALMSLQRLFRGKKWNVLRLRVDSVTYQADQLILGTILFTILLFLFPTTMLYYVVFSSIHLIILCVQSILLYFVKLLSIKPQSCDLAKEYGQERSTSSNDVKSLLDQLVQGNIINLS